MPCLHNVCFGKDASRFGLTGHDLSLPESSWLTTCPFSGTQPTSACLSHCFLNGDKMLVWTGCWHSWDVALGTRFHLFLNSKLNTTFTLLHLVWNQNNPNKGDFSVIFCNELFNDCVGWVLGGQWGPLCPPSTIRHGYIINWWLLCEKWLVLKSEHARLLSNHPIVWNLDTLGVYQHSFDRKQMLVLRTENGCSRAPCLDISPSLLLRPSRPAMLLLFHW